MKNNQQVINNLIEKELKFFKMLKQNENKHFKSRIRNIHREAYEKC